MYYYIFNFRELMTNTRTIYFNSAFRDAGGTDESFTITKSISLNSIPKRVKLLQVSIPDSWNNITAENNRVDLFEPAGPVTYNISIPVGRYTGTTLAAAIKTAFDTASANTYTVTYDSVSGRFTLSTGVNFQLDFDVANSIALAIGFVDGSITIAATSVTSPNVAMLQPGNEFFVISDLVLGADNGIIPWYPTVGPAGVLAVVPISIQGGMIFYTSPTDLMPVNALQSSFAREASEHEPLIFTLELAFNTGIAVELNGNSWSGVLQFEMN
jgi:hypothetical protein